MKRDSTVRVVSLYLLIIVCLASTLLPFVWMISTSFKQDAEIYTRTPVFIPHAPTTAAYRETFQGSEFSHALS